MKYVDGYACAFGVQKWCLDSSLSPADWASWAQAIGTTAAVFATLVVWWLSASEDARRARTLAAVFVKQLLDTLDELNGAIEARDLMQLMKYLRRLHEITLVGQSVPFERLPTKAVAPFFELRATAGMLDRDPGRHDLISWPMLKAELLMATADAKLAADHLGRGVRDWPLLLDDGVR